MKNIIKIKSGAETRMTIKKSVTANASQPKTHIKKLWNGLPKTRTKQRKKP